MGVSIKKTTVVNVLDSKGLPIGLGDTMLFKANGRVHIGVYQGIASRGALIFQGIEQFKDVEFHVMPSAIEEIYVQDM